MVKTLWLVRKLGEFPSELVKEGDVVILIQDGVLRAPSRENWFVCKEDAQARGLEYEEGLTKSYKEVVKLLKECERVVVW